MYAHTHRGTVDDAGNGFELNIVFQIKSSLFLFWPNDDGDTHALYNLPRKTQKIPPRRFFVDRRRFCWTIWLGENVTHIRASFSTQVPHEHYIHTPWGTRWSHTCVCFNFIRVWPMNRGFVGVYACALVSRAAHFSSTLSCWTLCVCVCGCDGFMGNFTVKRISSQTNTAPGDTVPPPRKTV